MLIEQITEFQLRGLGPPGSACTPTTSDFQGKAKISKKNWGLVLFTAKVPLRGQTLKESNSKCKIFNVFLT